MDGVGEGSKAGNVGGWEKKEYKYSLMTGSLFAFLMHFPMLRAEGLGKGMDG